MFRSGDKHSNHGDSGLNLIRHMVMKIKREYRWDVPIVIRMDSGFFDQKIFNLCEALHVGYVCGGRMYENIKQIAANGMTTSGNDLNRRKMNSANIPNLAVGKATGSALDGPSIVV